jgi:hypothetical protein
MAGKGIQKGQQQWLVLAIKHMGLKNNAQNISIRQLMLVIQVIKLLTVITIWL